MKDSSIREEQAVSSNMIIRKQLFLVLCYMETFVCQNSNTTRVLVLLPKHKGNFYYPFGMERVGAAVRIAIEDIEKQGILPQSVLQAEYVDTRCNDVYGLGVTSEKLLTNQYSAIIGPQCSGVCRHVGRLAAYHNIACFTGVCQDTEMLNKDIFKTLTRFLGTFDKVGLAVVGIMHEFSWERLSIISQLHTDKIWILTRDAVREISQNSGIFVSYVATYVDETEKSLLQILKEAASVSRIIVLAMRGETLRQILQYAHTLGLTNGDYVFLHVCYYNHIQIFGDISWQQGNEHDTLLQEAYRSVLFIQYYTPTTAMYSHFEEKVKVMSNHMFNYTYDVTEQIPYPAANLYEAMYMYAVSLNMTLDMDGDPTNGTRVARYLWNKTFTSITGNVSMDGNGDRQQGYTIQQTTNPHNFTLQNVGYFFTDQGVYEHDAENSILWINGVPPLDRPSCGYDGEFCDSGLSQTELLHIVVGTLVGILVLVVLLSVLIPKFIVRHIKKKANESIWRIREQDLVMTKKSIRSLFSMSKISIRSDSSNNEVFHIIDSRSKLTTAVLKGSVVVVRYFDEVKVDEKFTQDEFQQLRSLEHPNLNKILGFCIDPPKYFMASEFCTKGSLMDILENEDISMDWDFKCCLLWDIIKGLEYLFASPIRYHGNLRSSNCLVDGRFVLKLTDFGPRDWIASKDRDDRDLLWVSPEILRLKKLPTAAHYQYSDIYSLAIVMHELFQRNGPFGIETRNMQPAEIVTEVARISATPLRPQFEPNSCPPKLMDLIQNCWKDKQDDRPTIKGVVKMVEKITGSKVKADNFFDNLLKRMEQYANNLEGLVEERTSKYLQEKRRAEDLLYRLLPQSIAHQIQTRGFVDPEHYESVSILFTDIVQFTTLSAESTPLQIVEMLNDLYSIFDDTINEYDVYKVETIGDAYMCASGLPQRNTFHDKEVAKLTISVMKIIESFRIKHKPGRRIQLRAGIHTGSCVAGVIGVKMPRYCLFGDTVNTASRMESTSEASKIQISGVTADMLSSDPSFQVTPRGEVYVKGKGMMFTYWLEWKEKPYIDASSYLQGPNDRLLGALSPVCT